MEDFHSSPAIISPKYNAIRENFIQNSEKKQKPQTIPRKNFYHIARKLRLSHIINDQNVELYIILSRKRQ